MKAHIPDTGDFGESLQASLKVSWRFLQKKMSRSLSMITKEFDWFDPDPGDATDRSLDNASIDVQVPVQVRSASGGSTLDEGPR